MILRKCQKISMKSIGSPAHIVERARILRYGVQLPTQGAERTAIDAMTVCRTQNIGSSLVHRSMNHKLFDFAVSIAS